MPSLCYHDCGVSARVFCILREGRKRGSASRYVCVRGQAALERRVLEATRHATHAVEGEMSARLESDRWRLRCEQVRVVSARLLADAAKPCMRVWRSIQCDHFFLLCFAAILGVLIGE